MAADQYREKKFFNKTIQFFILIFFLVSNAHAVILNDKGMISETNVVRSIHIKQTQDIFYAIKLANQQNLKISISAVQHSQGGQTLIQDGIVLDMLPYNHVLNINKEKMQIIVEPGITWRKLQKIINSYHLSIGVMQSSNIFTVGGSMSVNAHGLDFRLSPFINTVVSFHLILANGKTIEVSRNKNPELWKSVIGGYGLLGVISDVTLQLVPDTELKSNIQLINIEDLNKIFFNEIIQKNNNKLLLGRLSIAPGKELLKSMLLITFSDTCIVSTTHQKLSDPENMDFIITPLFNWSRHSDIGKNKVWNLEKFVFNKKYDNKSITRNNAMGFAIDFAVNHHEKNHADWLQEYYLPPEKLTEFIDYLRAIVIKNQINLLNGTIRYVQSDTQTILSYSKKPTFSIVLYFDQELSNTKVNQAKKWTQNLIEKAQSLGGNYYLPYQRFATKEQFRKGYPGYKDFIKIKERYDPKSLFSSNFFVDYLE
jgi:decaprenylphospho-beta-D-ribofuranose 2-oxidase